MTSLESSINGVDLAARQKIKMGYSTISGD